MQELMLDHVPESNGSICRRCRKYSTVGRKGQVEYTLFAAAEGRNQFTSLDVPQPHSGIGRRLRQQTAIGRKSNPINPLRVAFDCWRIGHASAVLALLLGDKGTLEAKQKGWDEGCAFTRRR